MWHIQLLWSLAGALVSGFTDSGALVSAGAVCFSVAVCWGGASIFFTGGVVPGMYKGPRCPQAVSALKNMPITSSAVRRAKTKCGFTIRIRVGN